MRYFLMVGGSVLFLSLFAWIAALNGWNLLNGMRGRKIASFIPLIGGIFGFVGLLLLGAEWMRRWLWLPLVLDFGSLPLMAWTLFFFVFVLPFKGKQAGSDSHSD